LLALGEINAFLRDARRSQAGYGRLTMSCVPTRRQVRPVELTLVLTCSTTHRSPVR